MTTRLHIAMTKISSTKCFLSMQMEFSNCNPSLESVSTLLKEKLLVCWNLSIIQFKVFNYFVDSSSNIMSSA